MADTESYVYKKEIDWSVLMEGFTLPLGNQVVFLQNMGRFFTGFATLLSKEHGVYHKCSRKQRCQ